MSNNYYPRVSSSTFDTPRMKLISLKKEYFTYCNKKYEQRRWVTEDRMFLITNDELDHFRLYKANEQGKGIMVSDIYYQNNPHGYPIYSLGHLLDKIKEFNIYSPYQLLIHESQYRRPQQILAKYTDNPPKKENQ